VFQLRAVFPFISSKAFKTCSGRARTARRSLPIHQKFGGARDIRATRSAVGVKQIIAPDHLRVRIGKKRIGEPKLACVTSIDFHRIDTDRDQANPALLEQRKPFLKTP
jgi:hypothetical protein